MNLIHFETLIPQFPILPTKPPNSSSFGQNTNVCDRLRELNDTLNLAKAMEKELQESNNNYDNNWKDLLPELLELVLQRLTIDDYLKCRQICSSWRHVVDHALASKGRRCPPKPQLPLLLTQSSHSVTLRSCLTPQPQQHRAVFHMSDQDYWDCPLSMPIVQSLHSGWLMFLQQRYRNTTFPHSCRGVFKFFNPRSGAKFTIPNLTFSGLWSLYRSSRVEFAFAPGSAEFLVAILLSGPRLNQRLAFCKVMHGSWTSIIETLETRANRFRDIALCGDDDKLCAITKAPDTVFIFCLNKDPNLIVVKRLVMLDPNQALPTMVRGNVEVNDGISRDLDNFSRPSLAMDNTNGELLLVYHLSEKSWMAGRKASHRTKGFRVFSSGSPGWSEIRDLGDRFLFYDRSRVRALSAKDLDGAQEFGGGNCIFFCYANTLHVDNDDTFQNHDIGVFFLSTGKISTWRCSASSPAFRDSWFIPSLW